MSPLEPRAFVYEIGTEEMPARFLLPAVEQLKVLLAEALDEAMIGHDELECYATPRRLVAYCRSMSPVQFERFIRIKGPAANVAFDRDGNPTRAAIGFARSHGVSVGELKVEETERGKFVFVEKRVGGRATVEVLAEVLPAVTAKLSFPKMMRWGSLNFKFGRPIRWLLALFGNDVIRFELAGLQSDRISRGHRTLCKYPVVIHSAEEYFDALYRAHVILRHDERRELIKAQVEQLANSFGAKAFMTDELLDEVTFLMEHPTAVMCAFDERFLELPEDVLKTVMMHHQRYFPVVDMSGKLLPHFIAVRDGGTEGMDSVRQGYERVLSARFADAKFFFEEDLMRPLESYVEQLKGLLFQRDLGSMYEKVQRLKRLVERYCRMAGLDDELISHAVRAAHLCKADLATKMVQEFTELQGIMGYHYARFHGENAQVALAIREHYLPRFVGDELPTAILGALLGIADRMDTLCACFDRRIIPTGSADPVGLRRAATAVVNILYDQNLHLLLTELIGEALSILSDDGLLKRNIAETQNSLMHFFRGRLDALLQDKGIEHDIREAVLAASFDDVPDAFIRANALLRLKGSYNGFGEAVIAFTRVINILAQQRTDAEFEEGLLIEPAEKRLYDEFTRVKGDLPETLRGADESEYEIAFIKLSELKPAIDSFFGTAPGTGVLVMHPDIRLRENRLALLQAIERVLLQIADFSRLIV
ncbi:MAG: glycine--tRNA ligase subunit beta [Armatimonadota bacterium]|nr:glycine--tRNA ligase subunit beta [Armatimonadota bacterium]MCX7778076.1 glycine--tRNA ligase subunit beta [Armatimonadota bacterium]MDW8025755.1 glycine--tRNA ligase subunit beta [Armatimonadota bacterium]